MADKGSNLLAGLYKQMERISKLSRIRKALQRKAQNRSVLDISHIREETAEVPLFTQEGEAVHTDLCYVAKLKRIGAGETVILKGCQFFYVMSGSVTVTTEDPAPLKNKSDEQHRQAEGSAKERSSGGAGGVSEQEMRDLFNSIDADGSGAIDAEELQTALEMMGIQLSEENIAELLEGVDDDGSGELEFEEFVEILTSKLKLGKPPDRKWVMKEDPQGTGPSLWEREYLESHFFGEVSVLENFEYKITVLANEESDLVYLDGSEYHTILTEGFDGELKKKVGFLTSAPIVQSTIHSTDLRALAFAAQRLRFPAKSTLYHEGQTADAVYVIETGSCMVESCVVEDVPDLKNERRSMTTVLREDVMAGKLKRTRRVPVATLGVKDFCGEDTVAGQSATHTHSVVAVTDVSVFQIEQKVLQKLVHPRDVMRMRDHCRAILAWRKHQLSSVVTAVEEARGRAEDMLGRAKRMQRVVNEHRVAAGMHRASLSEISGIAKLADSQASVTSSHPGNLANLLRRIPPPTMEQQFARSMAAATSRTMRRSVSQRVAENKLSADHLLKWDPDSDAESEVSISEYATRAFKSDAVTRAAGNRAALLERTTADRVSAEAVHARRTAPAAHPRPALHVSRPDDGVWDGFEVGSEGGDSENLSAERDGMSVMLSEDVPMLRQHRKAVFAESGAAPAESERTVGAAVRQRRRSTMLAVAEQLLEEGPLAISIGLRDPAWVDPSKQGLTVGELKDVLRTVRDKVRQGMAWREDPVHTLAGIRASLQASRRVGLAMSPLPTEPTEAPEWGRHGLESAARDRERESRARAEAAAKEAGEGAARDGDGSQGPGFGANAATAGEGPAREGSQSSWDAAPEVGADGGRARDLREEAMMRSSARGRASTASSGTAADEATGVARSLPGSTRGLRHSRTGRRGERGPREVPAPRTPPKTEEEAKERLKEVEEYRRSAAPVAGGGNVPQMRLDTAAAMANSAAISGLFSKSQRYLADKGGGRLQAVATQRSRWWERDSTTTQANRTMRLMKKQEEELRRLEESGVGPEGAGGAEAASCPGGATMFGAGLLDGLPRLMGLGSVRNMQTLAHSASSQGGSQHKALRAAHAILRSPLTLKADQVGSFTPEQLGITGFARALNLAGVNITGGDMTGDWRGVHPHDTVAGALGAGRPGSAARARGKAGAAVHTQWQGASGTAPMVTDRGMKGFKREANGPRPHVHKTMSGRVLVQLPQHGLDPEGPGHFVEVCAPKSLNRNTYVRQVIAKVPKGRIIKDRKPDDHWH